MGLVGLRDVFVVAPAYHHHHHHHHQDAAISGSNAAAAALSADQLNGGAAATALGVGVIPLLTAGPCLAAPPQNVEDTPDNINFLSHSSRNRIQLWQNQSPQQTQYLPFKNQNTASHLMQPGAGGIGVTTGIGGVGSSSNSGGSASGTTTCQDCGNQAKKECSHKRCRTCCKSRGFDCPTHVKSTWVPAARRRERQLMSVATGGGSGSSVSTSGTKKPKLIASQQQQQQTTSHTSTSNTTPPRSFDTSSSHQDAGLREGWPRQVRAQAVFKCVRVTALEDGEDEYAYQAVVKIGGHVFKGFLYNQGVDPKDGFPNISELHLGGGRNNGNDSNTNNNNNGASSSSPILDATNVYGGSGGGGFLGGSGYGNQMS